MTTKTRVTVVLSKTIVYDLAGIVPEEQAKQMVKARIAAQHPLDLKEDITTITSAVVETIKE